MPNTTLESTKNEYTIREVAKLLGVHRDSISYWEEQDLIPKPRRNARNNYRVYNKIEVEEIARLRGINRGM